LSGSKMNNCQSSYTWQSVIHFLSLEMAFRMEAVIYFDWPQCYFAVVNAMNPFRWRGD